MLGAKDGKEVKYGTKGGSRPEYYRDGHSLEVKNYNVETSTGQDRLVRNVTTQAKARAGNLPSGTTQLLVIDVRGQNVSRAQLNQLVDRIVNKSGSTIRKESIEFLR